MTESTVVPEDRIVTSDEAHRLLQNAIKLKGGDYVYKNEFASCSNFKNETDVPQCIVGHVLHSLGLGYNDCGDGTILGTIGRLRDNRPEIKFTRSAVLLLQIAQTAQDTGASWGSAVASAEAGLRVAAGMEGIHDFWTTRG